MTRPAPVFMPAESCEADNAVIIECVIKQNRMDERHVMQDLYAFRMRTLACLVQLEKLDYHQVAELLESEAARAENAKWESDHA